MTLKRRADRRQPGGRLLNAADYHRCVAPRSLRICWKGCQKPENPCKGCREREAFNAWRDQYGEELYRRYRDGLPVPESMLPSHVLTVQPSKA
jgi:hypothetical protein